MYIPFNTFLNKQVHAAIIAVWAASKHVEASGVQFAFAPTALAIAFFLGVSNMSLIKRKKIKTK